MKPAIRRTISPHTRGHPLHSSPQAPMLILFLPWQHTGTMDINAHVIHGSDPGAVPGGSTNILLRLGSVGPK